MVLIDFNSGYGNFQDNMSIKWNGITKGESWCRGSRIEINSKYGIIFKSKKNILQEFTDDYEPLMKGLIDNDVLECENPKELAEYLIKAKEISKNFYEFINDDYQERGGRYDDDDRYFMYLENVNIQDIIKELLEVQFEAELNGYILMWV